MDELKLIRHGAERLRGRLSQEQLRGVERVLRGLALSRPGMRLHSIPGLAPLLAAVGSVGSIAASVLGSGCRPVRAILFDKTLAANWSLPWHQDRTIAVKERREVSGFGPWTIKKGIDYVEPPFELLAGMVTLRVHLDPVSISNAPLLIAPGSQRFGRIPASEVQEIVQCCGTAACLADRGDVWLYATPILHASRIAAEPSHRLVLQVDYAKDQLPGGLQWVGV